MQLRHTTGLLQTETKACQASFKFNPAWKMYIGMVTFTMLLEWLLEQSLRCLVLIICLLLTFIKDINWCNIGLCRNSCSTNIWFQQLISISIRDRKVEQVHDKETDLILGPIFSSDLTTLNVVSDIWSSDSTLADLVWYLDLHWEIDADKVLVSSLQLGESKGLLLMSHYCCLCARWPYNYQ